MKKFICIILSLTLLFVLFPTAVIAQDITVTLEQSVSENETPQTEQKTYCNATLGG